VAPNPNLEKHGGTLFKSDSIAGLARALGVDAAGLEKTVQDYNQALAAGTLGQLSPARSTKRRKAEPIATAPFYGAPASTGITYTMGGIRTDAMSRVLRPDRTPINGLYAAGATTGGLEGGPCVGYVGGLMKGIVFGLLAAETIAGKQ
jgi:fumarate reductase flavoprotein subunit